MTSCAINGKICISIVSHGHKKFVDKLIFQLAAEKNFEISQLIITCNRPDIESFDYLVKKVDFPFDVKCVNNEQPLGFGENHNLAFEYCESEFFCVVNPDIELSKEPFSNLVRAFKDLDVGLTYPSQVDKNSSLLDFERELVSPVSIMKRHLLRRIDQQKKFDPVHWVSGAFIMFRSSVFKSLCGFDERFFMYCEDVDICLRIQLAGYRLVRSDATVIHHTQRQTLKNARHLAWHVHSLLRLWSSAPYREYKQRFVDKNG